MSVTHLMARAARFVVTVVVFIFSLRLLFTAHGQTDNTVTCDVPSVEPLASTSVTCHFPENVSQTRRTITVSFYKGTKYTGSNENDILECWWLSGRMECDVQPGYKFNRRISHKLTLEIPRVSTKHIGGYVCKLSKMNPKNIKPCELKIKLEGKTMCDVPSVPLNSPTSLTVTSQKTSARTQQTLVFTISPSVMSQRTGDHQLCNIIGGYQFDQTLTNHLTLGIPNAQEDQEGSYTCNFTSSTPVRYERCSLTFITVTTFCNISSVIETEPASLTCTFNVDVNATKQNFSMVRIGGADNKGVDIVTCTWLKDQLKCTTAPGYEFNNIVTDHLVIRVPRASRDHTGTYACHVNGSKANGFQTCDLILKPVTTFCNISSIKETKPASLTCTFNVDVNSTKSNFSLVRLDGVESKAVDIVTCTWLDDQLKCTTAPGYEFNNIVTDHLVIRVLRASRDHTGTYACHVTGSSMDGFKPCELILIPDVPAVVLTVAIAVLVFIPVSLVIVFLVFTCKQRTEVNKRATKQVRSKETPLIPPVLSEEELKTQGKQEEEFWEKWVKAELPDLDSSFYFLPPVHFNRVSTKEESVAGEKAQVFQPSPQADESNQAATIAVQNSNVRHDAAIQRVLLCLERMFKRKKQVVVVVSQLLFDDYLRESCYADSARRLPLPTRHPSDLRQKWKQGDIDVLLIHQKYGLVICKVKAFGGDVYKHNISEKETTEQTNTEIKNNLQEAIEQLDRAGATVSYLASDVAPGLRVTKTIALPNLMVSQVQQVVVNDPELTQDLCRCLGTTNPADIAGVCLCCDQLSDPKTPRDVSSHVLKKFGEWWRRRVAVCGPDSDMTREVYKTLVARFCGPATTVSVPCTCPPRVSVKTLGQAVWCTGECYTAVITLFPEQLHLLHTQPPTLFVTGPPGTGKTVVLLLMAIQWLRCGHHVYVVSTWRGSRAACTMLYHLLLQTVSTQQSEGVSPGQPHLLQYNLRDREDLEKAVNDLSQAAMGGALYVIADEVGSEWRNKYRNKNFQTLCDKLLTQVPRLHLWATSYFHENSPSGLQVEYLTRPLRSPPVVVREVEQDIRITKDGTIKPYSERGVPDHTDGPPVRRLYHRGQGHSGDWPGACVTCGREVASFLHSLRAGVTERRRRTSTTLTSTSVTTSPCVQWRDVLVLYWEDVRVGSRAVIPHQEESNSVYSRVVKGLEEAGIQVRVMQDEDIEDVATARSDVVWVARGEFVRGLERKVIVYLDHPRYESLNFTSVRNNINSVRLDLMSRCTSQLVIVSPAILSTSLSEEIY